LSKIDILVKNRFLTKVSIFDQKSGKAHLTANFRDIRQKRLS